MDRNIDIEKCTLCGLCRMVCPAGLFKPGETAMQFTEQAAKLCIRCGHCIAACPEDAIQIQGLEASQFPPLIGEAANYDQLQNLLLSRRSVRLFEDRPVDQGMIEKILDAVGTAPSGSNMGPGQVCVLNGRDKIDPMISSMIEFYRRVYRGMEGMLSRFMYRRMMGKRQFAALKSFKPIADRMFEYYDRTGKDPVTWEAPLLLIFHAPRNAITCREDAIIACTYAMLAAHAQGLGTTMCGVIPPFVQQDRDTRRRLRIPNKNIVVLSLIAGHPKVKFSRGIKRPVEVQWG
jgi:ferredoxin